MTSAPPTPPPSAPATAPARRVRRARVGLHGRLTLAFVALVAAALGSSCWLYATQSADQLGRMLGEQARLIAYTLSLAAQPSMAAGKQAQLQTIGNDLLKTRNVLFVAFLNADRQPIALAKRYVDFSWTDVKPVAGNLRELTLVQPSDGMTFGQHVDVYAPVFATPPAGRDADLAAPPRCLGYVIVGVSLDREQAQLQTVTYGVAGIGGLTVFVSLPLAWLIVYGIFNPIRQLVDATRKIGAGRTDFRLDINRGDSIGELAQSFEDMVAKVGQQRADLAAANAKLNQTNAKLNVANASLNAANAKLSDANRDLEQKVKQRTAQLETANGRLSGEIAEKEDFLRAVSHDLNAPLRNIAGMAAMLLMKHRASFDEEVVHRLERIQKNVEVETDLINELLELSRIKTRRGELERVDTTAMVADMAGLFEEDLRARGIALVVDTALPPLKAERARVRQVFQNLIDNAIKYMGERPGAPREIHVGAVPEADETQFYVRDTGIGIEADDLDKVFHVFRRGRNAAAGNVPGKGVGLASVKSIVEMYSGTIWVESQAGEGSTFRFTVNGQFVAETAVRSSGDRKAA